MYGAPEYWGLGLSVVFMGIFIQMLGSPFLKSTFLFWSMMFGVIVSGIATTRTTATSGQQKEDADEDLVFWLDDRIRNAPVITFPWTKVAFAPGFNPEYFLPLLICSYITTAETIGDVAMTAGFSKVTDPVPCSHGGDHALANAPSDRRASLPLAGRGLRPSAGRRPGGRHQLHHRVLPGLAAQHHILAEQRHHRAHQVRVALGRFLVRHL